MNVNQFFISRIKCFPILLDATIYVGGLDDKVTESLMWELFVQSGPVGMCFIYISIVIIAIINNVHYNGIKYLLTIIESK